MFQEVKRNICLILVLLGSVWAVSGSTAFAKILKYVDDQGKVHYTDSESNIPMKYRSGPNIQKFRGVVESKPQKDSSDDSEGGESPGKEDAGSEEGLTPEDQKLLDRSIQLLDQGVKLAKGFEGAMPNFTNGRRLVNSIKILLPQKEKLAEDLAKSKVKELAAVRSFLQKSIAEDKKTQSVGQGLKLQLNAMFSRVRSEGKTQEQLVQSLKKAKELAEVKKEKAKSEASASGGEKDKPQKKKKNKPTQKSSSTKGSSY
jgi:hypothetical protein